MSLTSAQQTLLKTDIEANIDPIIVQALLDGTHQIIASFYNDTSNPSYYCWRTSILVQEIRDQHIDWSEVVDFNTNNLLSLQILIATVSLDPSKASIRQAFGSVFSGPGGATSLANLNAAAKRIVNRIEEVLSAKSQAGTEGDPDDLDFEGNITHTEISLALING